MNSNRTYKESKAVLKRMVGEKPWILRAYYTFLWFFGMPDKDGNYNTMWDRFPITYLLRSQKARLGWFWYVPVGLTFWGSYEWLCHMNFSMSWGDTLLGALSIPWFIFITWLFVHVDLTTDTGEWKKNESPTE